MKSSLFILLILTSTVESAWTQDIIPIDTAHWEINAQGHILENYEGQNAIYIHNGEIKLKDMYFLNGTIEYDIYLTERRAFPGVNLRIQEDGTHESFYLRPHQSGNPDATQVAPIVNGITGWQLYSGPAYSVTYDYNFDNWTHVKIVVNEKKAQVYFDYSEKPNLSWHLKTPTSAGRVAFTSFVNPMHYANIKINESEKEIVEFKVVEQGKIENIIEEWSISDKFEETLLEDIAKLPALIADRSWKEIIKTEENNVANISFAATRYGSEGNTVFAKITINADKDQMKLFQFGYSDRAVAILNGQAIYRGTNRFRTRDYRYLGTVGLFDAIYLNLKKGKNTLLFAVSEDFGGWGITGKFDDKEGIKIK
ncbi:MAG: DUF1080 domain-containing protein [Reichenbachiella sp.]